jgi:hypothetical protein
MPRHFRLFLAGATYHVYCRVARGEFVFDDDVEAIEFIEALQGCHVPHCFNVMGATFRFIIADRRERSCEECNNEVSGTLVVWLDLHGGG